LIISLIDATKVLHLQSEEKVKVGELIKCSVEMLKSRVLMMGVTCRVSENPTGFKVGSRQNHE
jgi:hypothetical protein